MKRLLLASTMLLAAACATETQVAEAPKAPAAPAVAAAAPAPAAPPVAAAAAAAAPAAPAAAPAPLPSIAPDYPKAEDWLCKPGIPNNACDVNIDATIVKA